LRRGKFSWACDKCIKKLKGLEADFSKVKFGYAIPDVIYIDKLLKCKLCSKKFTFTKEQQKKWFETFDFFHKSIPNECEPCRIKIRVEKNK